MKRFTFVCFVVISSCCLGAGDVVVYHKLPSFLGFEFGTFPTGVVYCSGQSVKVNPSMTIPGFDDYELRIDKDYGMYEITAKSKWLDTERADILLTNTLSYVKRELNVALSFCGSVFPDNNPLYFSFLCNDDISRCRGDTQGLSLMKQKEVKFNAKINDDVLTGREIVTLFMYDGLIGEKIDARGKRETKARDKNEE